MWIRNFKVEDETSIFNVSHVACEFAYIGAKVVPELVKTLFELGVRPWAVDPV